MALNAKGHTVGAAVTTDGNMHAYRQDDIGLHIVKAPGGGWSMAIPLLPLSSHIVIEGSEAGGSWRGVPIRFEYNVRIAKLGMESCP